MLASAKSMDDEAARLAVLRDPKRMAALLVRAFSSSMLEDANGDAGRRDGLEEEDEEVEETQEEFQELERRASAGTAAEAPLRVVICPADEDDDDAEEEEEEDENDEKPLDEEELEAAATALQTATRIVEELRLKMLLKAGEQMERQQQDNDELLFATTGSVMPPPLVLRSENSPINNGGPGVPVPGARIRSNSACNGCGKSFNPFHRSKNCSACGFAYCPKCSSKNVVLPSCFGYRDESVRTCDLCARWFQKAMDRYFDAMELTNEQEQDATVHRGSLGEITIEEKPRSASCVSNNVSMPPSRTNNGVLSVITRRSSVSSSDHVTGPDEEIADASVENDDQVTNSASTTSTSRRRHRHSSMSSTPSPSMNKNKPWFSGHLRAMHVNDRLPRKKKSRGESEGGDAENSPEFRSSNARRESNDRRKTRRSKFSRSASFDLTNLHAAASPDSSSGSPDLKRCYTFGPDEGRIIAADIASNGSGRSNSVRSLKAFDDSDIVDERAQPDSAAVKMKSEARLSAAVLRFAVYEMGAKETVGIRRTFGFTKANPVLDRYTLELDCRQRIVRAKSVFMHRFWSFHCDSVQAFEFGSSEGMAHLIVLNGGQGSQSIELKFANDDEREQFKQAMDSCRSTNLDRMRGFASRSAMSLPVKPELSSYVPDNLRSPTPQEPTTTFSIDTTTSIESDLELTHATGDSSAIDYPSLQSIHVPLLPGELVVKDTELQATMLIGPASETYEASLVWGRIRGKIALTNYRVIFTPFDRVAVQPRCGGQGGIAYIPLFAITHVQLLYPGGRRTKSGRSYSAGMA
ncbi:Myotubularin-like protein, partial [Phytophthora palmivora]